MIRATLADVATVNAYVGRDYPEADFTEFLSEPMHICLIEGCSGALFAWRGPNTFEVHVFFEVRGRAALDLGRRMLERMRTLHDAGQFWSLIPEGSRKVKMFARLMGWKSLGLRETRHGLCELFVSENHQCLQQ